MPLYSIKMSFKLNVDITKVHSTLDIVILDKVQNAIECTFFKIPYRYTSMDFIFDIVQNSIQKLIEKRLALYRG